MTLGAARSVSSGRRERNPRTVAAILWALLLLFALRVAGQAMVEFLGVTWLPPMREWYSGLVPYSLLLPAQLAILALLAAVCRDFTRGRGYFFQSRPWFARWALWFGWAYLTAMLLRYPIQMALHPEARWLHGTIPILFHCVLAGFVITFALYHRARLQP